MNHSHQSIEAFTKLFFRSQFSLPWCGLYLLLAVGVSAGLSSLADPDWQLTIWALVFAASPVLYFSEGLILYWHVKECLRWERALHETFEECVWLGIRSLRGRTPMMVQIALAQFRADLLVTAVHRLVEIGLASIKNERFPSQEWKTPTKRYDVFFFAGISQVVIVLAEVFFIANRIDNVAVGLMTTTAVAVIAYSVLTPFDHPLSRREWWYVGLAVASSIAWPLFCVWVDPATPAGASKLQMSSKTLFFFPATILSAFGGLIHCDRRRIRIPLRISVSEEEVISACRFHLNEAVKILADSQKVTPEVLQDVREISDRLKPVTLKHLTETIEAREAYLKYGSTPEFELGRSCYDGNGEFV